MMGVDLRLLPFDADASNLAFSHTILSCERRRELWEKIEKLPALKVPKDFTSFLGKIPDGSLAGDRGYGQTHETPYGDPLKYTTVEELLKLRYEEEVVDNWRNRAVWAYLSQLPPSTKVALFWH